MFLCIDIYTSVFTVQHLLQLQSTAVPHASTMSRELLHSESLTQRLGFRSFDISAEITWSARERQTPKFEQLSGKYLSCLTRRSRALASPYTTIVTPQVSNEYAVRTKT